MSSTPASSVAGASFVGAGAPSSAFPCTTAGGGRLVANVKEENKL